MTPFEQHVEDVKKGKVKVPLVTTSDGKINYFQYQMVVHKYNLGIMSLGMTCRGITFTQIKKYYGLKGRSAKDLIPQLEKMMEEWKF